MPQLRVPTPQLSSHAATKTPHATTKTAHSQIKQKTKRNRDTHTKKSQRNKHTLSANVIALRALADWQGQEKTATVDMCFRRSWYEDIQIYKETYENTFTGWTWGFLHPHTD